MKTTKKLTLSALLTALSVIFMSLGAIFEVFDLSACAIASLLVVFAFVELGSPYTYLVWLSSTLLIFIFFPGSVLFLEYFLVFGIYPIIKGYIEKLRRPLWLPIKAIFGAVTVLALILLVRLITGLSFFTVDSLILKLAVYLVLLVAFLFYDLFLTVLIRYYMRALRPRLLKFLK